MKGNHLVRAATPHLGRSLRRETYYTAAVPLFLMALHLFPCTYRKPPTGSSQQLAAAAAGENQTKIEFGRQKSFIFDLIHRE